MFKFVINWLLMCVLVMLLKSFICDAPHLIFCLSSASAPSEFEDKLQPDKEIRAIIKPCSTKSYCILHIFMFL